MILRRTGRGGRPALRTGVVVLASVGAILAVGTVTAEWRHLRSSGAAARAAAAVGSPTSKAPTSKAPTSKAPTSKAPIATAGTSPAAVATLARLVAQAPEGGVSVAVEDLTTGTGYRTGATHGMTEASVAKVEILETLVLQARGPLAGSVGRTATGMIENSSNTDADECFSDLGGSAAYTAAEATLGLSAETVLDQGGYWGLDTTGAADQVTLLRNLTAGRSPLTASARSYALDRLRAVEADQRWGVPVIADKGTSFAVKDGWLGVDSDRGRWAVNSDAMITYHGHLLAMSIMTQHDPTERAGIDEVQSLAAALAVVVDPVR